ncbi:MAG: ice-binding family protein [Lutibacter sp.]|nr:ice-binding family protein [Lutibacter sp.]
MIAKKLLTTIAFAFVLLFSGCADDDFNQIDGVCPLVVSTVPEDGDIDVPLNQVITATFNEKMNPTTITGASFTVSANGTLVAGTVTYSNLTATFTPSSLLDEDTEYTGTITTLAKDERGNALQENYVWTFVTVLPLPEFSVAVSSNPSIGGLTAGAGIFDQGTAVTVTAIPNVGYTFTNWTDNGIVVSTSANYTFVLIGDRTLVANYTLIPPAQFAVNTSALPVAGGSTTGSGSFDVGSNVTVTATANVGYTFVNWTLAGVQVSTNANYTFVLNANTTLVANFVVSTYTLNVTAQNGSVVINPDNLTYNNGDNVVLTATPNSGYQFTSWSGDATGTNNPLTVLMDGNKNITANFTLITTGGLCPSPAVDLGLAGNYAVLAESAISTTGVTSVTGDMGISPLAASFITGFGLSLHSSGTYSTSSLVTGKIYAADYTSPTPSNLTITVDNMHTAFTTANGLAPNYTELYAGDINNRTLQAGVYKYGTGLLLTNTITLDGGGVDCAAFVFQIAGDLTVSNNVKIVLINGAKADNIFWVTAGAGAVIGTDVDFSGNILSKTLISLEARSIVKGRLLAQSAVSLIGNTVVKPN